MPTLKKYQITVSMPDGSVGHGWGLFVSSAQAVDAYLCVFGPMCGVVAEVMP